MKVLTTNAVKAELDIETILDSVSKSQLKWPHVKNGTKYICNISTGSKGERKDT